MMARVFVAVEKLVGSSITIDGFAYAAFGTLSSIIEPTTLAIDDR